MSSPLRAAAALANLPRRSALYGASSRLPPSPPPRIVAASPLPNSLGNVGGVGAGALVRSLATAAPPSSQGGAATVGFVGLGNMGLPMAANVLTRTDRGGPDRVTVVAYDPNRKASDEAGEAGAEIASSVGDVVAAGCDAVFTVLPDDGAVRGVFDEMLDAARGGGGDAKTVFVDCSTVSPALSKRLHSDVAGAGSHFGMLDAPVSGGVKGARAGTLSFMVGSSSPASLEAARPFLNRMGSNVLECGGPGSGSSVKLCNNLALACQMVGICEAMNLGEALGVDPLALADAMGVSTAGCWSCESDNPHPDVARAKGGTAAANDYEGGFASRLMLKDVGLAVGAGQETGVALPLGTTAKELYRLVEKRGLGNKDFGVMLQFLRGM